MAASAPKIGDHAPEFSLPGSDGRTLTLGGFAGSKLVLYFYPKDDTSGCTLESMDFNRLRSAFEAKGALVVGVSPDSPKSHDKFKAKHGLSLDLVSDEEKSMLAAYGVWVEKSMYGRKYMGVERSTFLIDSSGIITNIWSKVKVAGHAEEVLAAL